MPQLSWISDEDLEKAVDYLLKKAKAATEKVEQAFGKNVIDPFSAIFVMSGFNLDFNSWKKSEVTRQLQKTLQNHVGEFHQNILGSIHGWNNLQKGNIVDLESPNKKIIAEIKNKYNTISGGKLADLYFSLEEQVMPKNSVYRGFTAYYVAIIPKNRTRYNKPFTPSDKSKGIKCTENNLIREIDGASFYDLATGSKNALSNLYNSLPKIISKVSQGELEINDFDRLRAFFDSAFETLD